MAPFTKDYQKIVYEPFIDYETGEIKEGSQYFKQLSRTILQYVEYMENKSEGDIGVLERIKSLNDKTPFIRISNFTHKYKKFECVYELFIKHTQNVVTIRV